VIAIGTLRIAYLETPPIHRPSEAAKAIMIKVFEADNTSQLFFVDNPPTATMWHPTDDVLVL
jgi:hypothetical protein